MAQGADDDPVFQQGLESILAPLRARGASQDEIDSVTAQARSFYLASAAPASSTRVSDPPSATAPLTENDAVTSIEPAPATTATASQAGTEAPYPSSFASLAALIASGAPIPGIKEIPDKLAEGEPSESKVNVAAQGKKPWEKQQEGAGAGAQTETMTDARGAE